MTLQSRVHFTQLLALPLAAGQKVLASLTLYVLLLS